MLGSSSSKISGFPVANNFNDIFISFEKKGGIKWRYLNFEIIKVFDRVLNMSLYCVTFASNFPLCYCSMFIDIWLIINFCDWECYWGLELSLCIFYLILPYPYFLYWKKSFLNFFPNLTIACLLLNHFIVCS